MLRKLNFYFYLTLRYKFFYFCLFQRATSVHIKCSHVFSRWFFQGQSPGRFYQLGRDGPKMRCWPCTTNHLRIKGESRSCYPQLVWSWSHVVPAKKTLNSLLKYVLLWEFKVMWCRTTLTRQYTLENGWWPSSPFSGRNGSIKINITTQLRWG